MITFLNVVSSIILLVGAILFLWNGYQVSKKIGNHQMMQYVNDKSGSTYVLFMVMIVLSLIISAFAPDNINLLRMLVYLSLGINLFHLGVRMKKD